MTLRLGSRVAATPFIGSMSRKTAESRNMLCPEANATQNGGRQNSCQKRTQSCGKWKQKGTRIHKWDRKSGNKVETRLQKADQRSNEVGRKWETRIHNVRPEKQQSGTKVEQNGKKNPKVGPEDPWIRPKVGTQSWPWKVYILPIYTIPIMSFFIQDCK